MVGKTISHYQILEKLGEGGMGVVYKARDSHLKRFVALKVLPPEKVADPGRKERFVQEARAASALNHPNIVTIYDIDRAEGVDFIAMEYVEGKTLDELIGRKGLKLNEALKYAVQIADALAKAHAAGIIHRDLKPSNMMVTADGRAKVLDFGLAKLTEAAALGADDSTITEQSSTQLGLIVGTVSYMSPEQAEGKKVDARSDIFSFGSLLYEMVAGRRAFQGNSKVATLAAIIKEEPAPLAAEIPQELSRLITRCLRKDPERRFQLMKDLKVELAELGESTLTVSDPVLSILPPAPTRVATRRWAMVAGALFVLSLAIGAWTALHWRPLSSGVQLPEDKLIAVLPFKAIDEDRELRALSDGMAEMLTSKLTQLEQLQGAFAVVPASEIRSRTIDSVDRARRQYGVNLAITGSIQRLGSTLQITANLVDAIGLKQLRAVTFDASQGDLKALRDTVIGRVVGMLEVQITPRAEQELGMKETDRAEAYFAYLEGRGYLHRFDVQGNVDRAIQSLEKALRADPNYAFAHAALGEAYWRKALSTNDKLWADRAVDSARKAVQLGGSLAIPHIKLGEIYGQMGRSQEAIHEFQLALNAQPSNADAYRGLGRTYAAIGLIQEAERAHLKAVHLRPTDWYAYNLLGVLYADQGQYDKAELAWIKARDLTPDNDYPYRNLGGLYVATGKFELARGQLEKSIAIKPSFLAYLGLAQLLYYAERPHDAIVQYKTAIPFEPNNHLGWGGLGDAYAQIPGGRGDAEAAFDKAIVSCQRRLALAPADNETLAYLASYQAKRGQKAKALETLSRLADSPTLNLHTRFAIAVTHEVIGERQLAIKEFKSLLPDQRSATLIRADPSLKQIRRDPAFVLLLGRERLP